MLSSVRARSVAGVQSVARPAACSFVHLAKKSSVADTTEDFNHEVSHEKQLLSASEAFVETLVANGCDTTFGIVGSAFMDALDIFESAGIRFISVQHEQNAAHMADGYARALNKPGVCIAQNGPGISNFVTGIAAAYWNHAPVVCITPQSGTNTEGLGGFQETNQLPMFETITKYQAHVPRADRIAELTNRCFHYSMLERGPVQLNIPRDHFYGEFETSVPRPIIVERGAGSPNHIRQAAELLKTAKNPVIVSGAGVVMANGVDEVVGLAEHMSAPVVNSYLHNDSFPANHQLWCGPLGYQGSKAAMNIIKDADVVLALGTRIGPFGTLPQHGIDYWPKNAKVIQVDADIRKIGLVKDITLGINGDARLAASAILDELRNVGTLESQKNSTSRLQEVMKAKQEWEDELNAWGQDGAHPIAPRRALRELEKALPSNAIVATDIGNICSISNSYLRFNKPNSFLAAGTWGNCGYAFPAAMGAKVADPSRPAIAYVGDGAWGMSLNEMMTCVRENIPTIAVVFRNNQWGAEKKNQVDFYSNRFVGTNLDNPSFAEIARAMGAEGITVDHADQIGDALRKLIDSGRPGVLEIDVTQELGDPFRRDALKKPKRVLQKYKSCE